ncbi:MAG TPA: hypothetical protein VFQ85_14410 [Mycobacteriales bacterium]|jgi:hypothetical protein|nr:hypothetical protein [Mycobacteriales bacterium]
MGTGDATTRAAWIGVIGVVVAALITAAVTLYVNRDDNGGDGGSRGVQAHVRDTWDDARQALIGVSRYPSAFTNVGRMDGPHEGDLIEVVCQERHGRLVTDTPYHDRQTSSSVWDRLADGTFVSDIYTDLPKTSGDTPPRGLPRC